MKKVLVFLAALMALCVPVMAAGKTAIIVTGDASRNKTMCVPGGGFASVKIELPEKWDDLMKTAGYKPLRSFHLKSDFSHVR